MSVKTLIRNPLPFFLFILCVGWAQPNYAQGSLIDKIQKAQESVVQIKTEFKKVMRNESGDKLRMVSFERNAAGIVIDARGIIVANTHTVLNAPTIYIMLKDGTRLRGEVFYTADKYDFSFIRVKAPYKLKPITWAESSQVNLGDSVVAIGNAEIDNKTILGGKVTSIVQSRSSRTIELLGLNLNLYRGDSGGPIFDKEGHLMGIVMAKSKSQNNESFCIASDKIREQYLLNVPR